MIEIIYLIIGILIGFFIGFFYSKYEQYRSLEKTIQPGSLNNIAAQVNEMKIRFVEIEKSREKFEEQRQKMDVDREKRFTEYMLNTQLLFKEISDKNQIADNEKEKRIKELMEQNKAFFAEQKTQTERFLKEQEKNRESIEKKRDVQNEEKEKRIQELMEQNKKFFEEQKKHTEKFLSEQEKNRDLLEKRRDAQDEDKDKRIKEVIAQYFKLFDEQKLHTEQFLKDQGISRDEIEKKRDAQISDMNRMIQTFTKTIAGMKTRGMVGEEILKDVLSDSIKADVVQCNLRTDRGEVEFAWNLEDGKYIPIDSKLPEVMQLLESYYSSNDLDEQRRIKKEIIDKVKKELKRVQKYQNLSNTIDTCILVVPEGILEIAPELVGIGKTNNIYVCSYKDVFPLAHLLQEQHINLKEQGDIGEYKGILKALIQILEKILRRTETIEKAITQIENANDDIKKEVHKGKSQQIRTRDQDEE